MLNEQNFESGSLLKLLPEYLALFPFHLNLPVVRIKFFQILNCYICIDWISLYKFNNSIKFSDPPALFKLFVKPSTAEIRHSSSFFIAGCDSRFKNEITCFSWLREPTTYAKSLRKVVFHDSTSSKKEPLLAIFSIRPIEDPASELKTAVRNQDPDHIPLPLLPGHSLLVDY